MTQGSDGLKGSDGFKPSRPLTVRSRGLMLAVEFESFEINKKVIDELIMQGVFTDWFLFAANCLRIVPPLTISEAEIRIACEKIFNAFNAVYLNGSDSRQSS